MNQSENLFFELIPLNNSLVKFVRKQIGNIEINTLNNNGATTGTIIDDRVL